LTKALISPDQLAWIVRILRPYAEALDHVAVFGSRATGRARSNSDIDLVLYGRLQDADIDRIRTMFEESALSVSVDVLLYSDHLYSPLKRHIDQSAVVLLSSHDLVNVPSDHAGEAMG
jgi:predicted nucleotidyltransferase